jgi:Fanconi anemia group M protein
MNVDVITQRLEVGDYDVGEQVLIERKTGPDYVSSLADGRLFEQALRLTESAEQVIIILENFQEAFTSPGWNNKQKQVYGSLMYLSLRLGILLFPTSDKTETAQVLERICSWVQEKKDDPVIFARGVKKSMSQLDRQQFLLQGLPQIGPKTALALLKQFKTPMTVFEAISNSSVTFTKTGNPKGIEGPLSELAGIGPKFLLKTKEVLRNQPEKDL